MPRATHEHRENAKRDAKILWLWEQGVATCHIGERYGLSPNGVLAILAAQGVRMTKRRA